MQRLRSLATAAPVANARLRTCSALISRRSSRRSCQALPTRQFCADDNSKVDQRDTSGSRVLFRARMLWPVQTLTAFAAVDTAGTVAVMASMANHTDKLPEEYRMFYLGGFAMFACVPPLLLASLHWIRTRLVVSVVASRVPDNLSISTSDPNRTSTSTNITLGFASLLPGGVGSQRSFASKDLRTEYDGGIAYLVMQDTEAARAEGLPTRFVLDPIEMANVWSDEEKARELLEAMNRMGERHVH